MLVQRVSRLGESVFGSFYVGQRSHVRPPTRSEPHSRVLFFGRGQCFCPFFAVAGRRSFRSSGWVKRACLVELLKEI